MYARPNRPLAVARHHAAHLLREHPIDWADYPGLTEAELEEASQRLDALSEALLVHADSAGWATEAPQITNPK